MPNRETLRKIENLEGKIHAVYNNIINTISNSRPVMIIDFIQESCIAIGNHKSNILHENLERGIIITFNSWEKDTFNYTHYHPEADEYLYIMDGKLLLTHLSGKLDILIPSEKVPLEDIVNGADIKGWVKIGRSTRHSIRAIEDTQFVTKYVINKHDD